MPDAAPRLGGTPHMYVYFPVLNKMKQFEIDIIPRSVFTCAYTEVQERG